jgi:hypothetical protein
MQHREQLTDTPGRITIPPRLRRTTTRPHPEDTNRVRRDGDKQPPAPSRDSNVTSLHPTESTPHQAAGIQRAPVAHTDRDTLPIRRVNTSDATTRHPRKVDSHHHKNNTVTTASVINDSITPISTTSTTSTPHVDAAALGPLEIIKSGYIIVHSSLWDYLPAGAHVQFTESDGRFNRGGFIKCHYIDSAGERALIINTTCRYKDRPANTAAPRACVPISVRYSQIDTLWKKYDMNAFIEIHLIYNSLAQKKQQITELQARVIALEAEVRAREGIVQTRQSTS